MSRGLAGETNHLSPDRDSALRVRRSGIVPVRGGERHATSSRLSAVLPLVDTRESSHRVVRSSWPLDSGMCLSPTWAILRLLEIDKPFLHSLSPPHETPTYANRMRERLGSRDRLA